MIDIHAHVIPGVDDGPIDMDAAVALLQQAVASGVTQVVATPHYHLPSFDNYSTLSQYQALKAVVQDKGIPIKLHLGNEIYADSDVIANLESGNVNTLGGTDYILLELPISKIFPVHLSLVFKLQVKGYRVILAHVDRYQYFREDPDLLKDLIDKGCYGQLSAEFVSHRPREAKRWLEGGYAHFVASDMHDFKRRPNRLNEAKRQIAKHLGDQWVQQLFIENPTALLHHREVLRVPTKALRSSWLEIFIK